MNSVPEGRQHHETRREAQEKRRHHAHNGGYGYPEDRAERMHLGGSMAQQPSASPRVVENKSQQSSWKEKLRMMSMNADASSSGSSDSESSEPETQEQFKRARAPTGRSKPQLSISIKNKAGRGAHRPQATQNCVTPGASCTQLDRLVRMETAKFKSTLKLQGITEAGKDEGQKKTPRLSNAKLQVVTRKFLKAQRVYPPTPRPQDILKYDPCYIVDTVKSILIFLPMLDVVRLRLVSKTWDIAGKSTLRRRLFEDAAVSTITSAKAAGVFLSKLNSTLPCLQVLNLDWNGFRQMHGPREVFFWSHLCECRQLEVVTVTNMDWKSLESAADTISQVLARPDYGHPVMERLHTLELPDASLPLPTSTQCVRNLATLTPNLHTLAVKSAQDPLIFSLRLFLPSVKHLITDTLYTTQRFAQILLREPALVRWLAHDSNAEVPRTPMILQSSSTPGNRTPLSGRVTPTGRRTPSGRLTPSGRATPQGRATPGRKTPGGSVRPTTPVTPNTRLTPRTTRHSPDSLVIEPACVKRIETMKELTFFQLQKFASFCALIGAVVHHQPDTTSESEDNMPPACLNRPRSLEPIMSGLPMEETSTSVTPSGF